MYTYISLELIVAAIVQDQRAAIERCTKPSTAIDTTQTTLQLRPVIDLLLRIILLSAVLKECIDLCGFRYTYSHAYTLSTGM